jgi:hypothetical protein
MATINTKLSLLDHAKRMDPTGKIAEIVEMLNQDNEILTDLPYFEGNLPTGHQVTMRTGIPEPTLRVLNKGVAVTKSTTAQVTEACSIIEDRGQIDVEVAALNGNTNEFRLSENAPHVEGIGQKMADLFFYGNASLVAGEFTGLSPRYNSLSADNAQNIVNAGGAGADNMSIWLAVLGPQTLHGFFPKGSMAGIMHKDLGEGDAFDSDNNRFRALMDLWQVKTGLCLRDWRFAVRICNIDKSNLVAESSEADLITLMTKAIHRVPGGYAGHKKGKAVWWMNRTCIQQLDIQRYRAVSSGGGLTYEVVDGKWVPHFRGIPIRVCDALVENEAVVS